MGSPIFHSIAILLIFWRKGRCFWIDYFGRPQGSPLQRSVFVSVNPCPIFLFFLGNLKRYFIYTALSGRRYIVGDSSNPRALPWAKLYRPFRPPVADFSAWVKKKHYPLRSELRHKFTHPTDWHLFLVYCRWVRHKFPSYIMPGFG